MGLNKFYKYTQGDSPDEKSNSYEPGDQGANAESECCYVDDDEDEEEPTVTVITNRTGSEDLPLQMMQA